MTCDRCGLEWGDQCSCFERQIDKRVSALEKQIAELIMRLDLQEESREVEND